MKNLLICKQKSFNHCCNANAVVPRIGNIESSYPALQLSLNFRYRCSRWFPHTQKTAFGGLLRFIGIFLLNK